MHLGIERLLEHNYPLPMCPMPYLTSFSVRVFMCAIVKYFHPFSCSRCYRFLSTCGNGRLLLDCATKEAETIDLNSEALAVLHALQMHIDKVGFNSSKA